MAVTQKINSKSNIKNTTNRDLPFSPQQPVIARYDDTSTASQTVINMSFSVDQSNKEAFEISIDGKELREGASHDYTFTSIGSDNTSSQITLNYAIPVNLNIKAKKFGTKKESEFQTDNRFVALYEAQDQGFQGFVKSSTLRTATSTTGAPAAGVFYSQITNRASMIDLSQDLKAVFGNDRIPVQQVYQLQNEFGANGEIVSAAVNDTFGQARFVGTWSNNNDSSGQSVSTVTTNDYIEMVIYGTGLNILLTPAASMDFRVTVDGGTEGANLAVSYSTILNARGYSPNTVINVASGLTLGVHTIKIRNNAAAGIKMSGFEAVTAQTSIQVNPGIAYLQNKKLTLGTASLYTPSTGVTGTRGGRIINYLASDSTLGRAFQAVNAAQANLTSADHTNEEGRHILFSEFGANRADDFSTTASNSARAFTLEDGTTTLVATNATITAVGGVQSLQYGVFGASVIIHFVGTGLDIRNTATVSATALCSISVDGTSIASSVAGNTLFPSSVNMVKIVSGLPYGSHTVRISNTSGSGISPAFDKFIVYQPKKPAIPSGAVELQDYCVMANYSANATAGVDNLGTGTLRKSAMREMTFVGGSLSVSGVDATNYPTGWEINLGSSGVGEIVFYGTGFEMRGRGNTAFSATNTIALQNLSGGSLLTLNNTNFPSLTTSSVGGWTFTYSSGNLSQATATTAASGMTVSGLTLGWYKLRITNGTANGCVLSVVDVITPIHSHKPNISYDQQNTLPVGSCAISDNRKFTPVKDLGVQKRNISQAVGVTINPSTSSTSLVPLPDLSVTHTNTSGRIKVTYSTTVSNTSATNSTAIFVDGVQYGTLRSTGVSALQSQLADSMIINVPPGVRKVDVYWKTSASTVTASNDQRSLQVEEL